MKTAASAVGAPERVHALLGPVRELLARLQRSQALGQGDLDAALAQLTEAASQALDVERASVWRFNGDGSELGCMDLYQRSQHAHSRGIVLRGVDSPRYFEALRQERAIAADDARTDPRTSEFTPNYLTVFGISSMLDAPIFLDGKLMGVVCHEHVGERRAWQPWEDLLAGTFADFAALMLGAAERAAQARALEEYKRNLEVLVSERTRQLQASEENFRRLFEAAPVALILIGIAEPVTLGGNAYAASLFGLDPRELSGQRASDYWVDQEARLRFVSEVRDRGTLDGYEARLRTRDGKPFWAEVSARLISLDGEPVLLYGIRDITTQKEAAEALRKSGEQLRILAETDALTGLPNRRHALDRLRGEIDRAARYQRPLSLAMLDMDHFKTINDRAGHLVGDEALRLVAATVQKELRAQDQVGRYGGEELLLVFPESGLDAAAQVVERVRAAVAGLRLMHNGEPVPLALSGGVVQWRAGESLDDALRRADGAMFEAKRAGRNRLIRG